MLHEPILQLVEKLSCREALARASVDIFWLVELIELLSAKQFTRLDLSFGCARLRRSDQGEFLFGFCGDRNSLLLQPLVLDSR